MSTFPLTQIVMDPTHFNHKTSYWTLYWSATMWSPVKWYPLLLTRIIEGYCSSGNGRNNEHLRSKPRTIWRYNLANFEMACNLPTLQCGLGQCNERNWYKQVPKKLGKRFMDVMEKCIPKGTLPRPWRKNPPWLTKNLLRAMCKRNSLFRRARNTNHPTHWKAYRNMTVSMLRQSKNFCLYQTKKKNSFGKPRNTWEKGNL